jgi:hypothetical protein
VGRYSARNLTVITKMSFAGSQSLDFAYNAPTTEFDADRKTDKYRSHSYSSHLVFGVPENSWIAVLFRLVPVWKGLVHMFKTPSSKLVLIAVFCVAAMVACGDSDETSKKSAVTTADSLLNFVPANSPYVFANLAPLPDDVFDKLEPKIDRILSSYQVLLQEIVAMAAASSYGEGDSEEDPANQEKAVAVMGELSSLLSIEGLRSAGFERSSRSVLYGNGLLPVLRLEVSDGALFEAALARVEESAGEAMETVSIAGNPVRYVNVDKAKVLVAILDKQVVMSIAPVDFAEQQLGSLLGFTTPVANIAKSGVLQKISGDYDYEEYFVGYLDLARIVSTVTGDAEGLDADLVALAAGENVLSDVCRAEIREMVGIAPRMVMGYSEISADQFKSQAVFELRDDIAAGLKTWPAAVPGLGGDAGGLMSFGMSLDVMAVRKFVEARLDAMEKDPYACEYFAELQSGVAEVRASLNQPPPPMVYDFRGLVAVIQNIEGLNMATQTPPTSVEGRFLLAMNNAPALVALGTMMSPELAGLGLQPDSKPVLLDLPQAQMLGQDLYVALSDEALALSIGDGAETELGTMLSAKAQDNGTVFSFSMDARRYYRFIAEAMEIQEADDDAPMSPEFQQAMKEIMLAIADIYDRMSADVRFTDDGIVIDSVVSLGD